MSSNLRWSYDKSKENDLVSVVIPTFNRFDYLKRTLNTVQNQTYKNIEIIVVNDCSTEQQYYNYNWDGIKIIHLEKSSKEVLGYPCVGYVRNFGIKEATGKYIAFCDDDDLWYENKIEAQLYHLKNLNFPICCSEAFIGNGIYNPKKSYKLYNSEFYFKMLQDIFKKKGSSDLDEDLPLLWNYDFLKVHNCVITSSIILEKSLLEKVNYMPLLKKGREDHACWLEILKHTKFIVYIKNPLLYYDLGDRPF